MVENLKTNTGPRQSVANKKIRLPLLPLLLKWLLRHPVCTQVSKNTYLQSCNVGGGLSGIRVDFSVRFVHSLAKQGDRIRPVRGYKRARRVRFARIIQSAGSTYRKQRPATARGDYTTKAGKTRHGKACEYKNVEKVQLIILLRRSYCVKNANKRRQRWLSSPGNDTKIHQNFASPK